MDVEEDVAGWVERRVGRFYWLSGLMGVLGGVRRSSVHGRVLYDFFVNHFFMLDCLRSRMLSGSFCLDYCSGFCCYFPGEYSNQLPVSVIELESLRKLIAESGHRPCDYYTLVPLDGLSLELRRYVEGMPGFVMDVDGTPMACMLNPSDRVVDGGLLSQLPRLASRSRRMWVNHESRACRFLGCDSKCMLYSRLRFRVCREFLCLTALTAVVLKHLGVWDGSGMSMSRLNAVAEEVALAFRRRGLLARESAYDLMLRELAVGYMNGDDMFDRYLILADFQRDYDRELEECLEDALTVA